MAHSVIEYQHGAVGPYAVNFMLGFLSRSHVTAYIRGELDALGQQVFREITWVTDGLVNIAGGIPVDGVLVLDRNTPYSNPVHDYQSGAVLTEDALDESNKQALMLIQELRDGKVDLLVDSQAVLAEATKVLEQAALVIAQASVGTPEALFFREGPATVDLAGYVNAIVMKEDNSAGAVQIMDSSGNTVLRCNGVNSPWPELTSQDEVIHLVLRNANWVRLN